MHDHGKDPAPAPPRGGESGVAPRFCPKIGDPCVLDSDLFRRGKRFGPQAVWPENGSAVIASAVRLLNAR